MINQPFEVASSREGYRAKPKEGRHIVIPVTPEQHCSLRRVPHPADQLPSSTDAQHGLLLPSNEPCQQEISDMVSLWEGCRRVSQRWEVTCRKRRLKLQQDVKQ